MMPAKLVVLTPVRNEAAWLQRFLAVTTQFADHIVVADQGSTDGSAEMCRAYPGVTVIANGESGYDEGARQRQLIEASRRLIPGDKVLLALDADEILAADAPAAPDWNRMLTARPGTVVLFEKPDLYLSTRRCLRYDRPWPLAYVDDGRPHVGQKVHSLRLPTPEDAERLHLAHAKVLHYALTRPEYQSAKARYYCVQENLLGLRPLYARRHSYSARRDWSQDGRLEASDPAWFHGWEQRGVEMHRVPHDQYHWQDFEVLQLFRRHGVRRFWLDDIWGFDWEACRHEALRREQGEMPVEPVPGPPAVFKLAGLALDRLYASWRALRSAAPHPPAGA